MDVEDVEIHLLTGSGNVDEFCEASTSGNVVARSLEQFVMVGEPRNGMEFESKEAAYYSYREYARSVGFGITIKASRRSKRSGKFIDVKIACSRFGTKRDKSTSINPRSCPKTACKAGLNVKRKEDEKWVTYNFVKEHNHEICPDDFYISIRGKNKPIGALANQKKGLQVVLEKEDLKLMLEHLTDMQDKQPGFFYTVDFDCDKNLRNLFWLDAKAKHDYCSFSDVVLFDTFYVRNNYKIPFAPFVGVSHHRQYMLLGCALIGEESESTYSWLFRSWLKAVGAQAPGVIITDQDKLLSDIVVEVFPSARHFFCLWSVLSKIPEMLNPFVSQDVGFMESFRNCIDSSWTDDQFERRWSNMICKFELNKNEWVQLLFRDRKKWVPHYFNGVCLAGMAGPERHGSIASQFDKYMNPETTFKDFYEIYMDFLQYRCDVEAQDDLESQSKQPTLRSSFEKQLSLIYTDAAFKKFQAEVPGVVSCQLQKEREDGTTAIFCVEDFEKRQNFFVTLNKQLLDVCCSCHLFEYQGFLCKHAILVLQNSDVSCIPSQYILNRWSKKGNSKADKNKTCARKHNQMARFDDLCRRFVKLGVVASLSDEAYKTALNLLEENMNHCVSMNNYPKFPSDTNKLTKGGSIGLEIQCMLDCGSKLSKKKKIQKKRKVYNGPEDATNKSKQIRQGTEQVSSRSPTFENCYIPQADIDEAQLGSRATTLGVYYSTQQTIQIGNMYSVHGRMSQYETQPSIQGAFQGQTSFRGSAIRGCYDIEETLHDMTMESSQFQSSGPSE